MSISSFIAATTTKHRKYGAWFLQELPCLHLDVSSLSGLAAIWYVLPDAQYSFYG